MDNQYFKLTVTLPSGEAREFVRDDEETLRRETCLLQAVGIPFDVQAIEAPSERHLHVVA